MASRPPSTANRTFHKLSNIVVCSFFSIYHYHQSFPSLLCFHYHLFFISLFHSFVFFITINSIHFILPHFSSPLRYISVNVVLVFNDSLTILAPESPILFPAHILQFVIIIYHVYFSLFCVFITLTTLVSSVSLILECARNILLLQNDNVLKKVLQLLFCCFQLFVNVSFGVEQLSGKTNEVVIHPFFPRRLFLLLLVDGKPCLLSWKTAILSF